MPDRHRHPSTLLASALAAVLALSAVPFGMGVAAAADALPPPADPIAAGAVCDRAPSANPFTDLTTESPATRETILCMVATGLTAGTTRTTYTPGGLVTRRQMALFIKRLADEVDELERVPMQGLPPYDGIPDYRDVVTEEPAFREAIGQLNQAGIVGGFPDGTFRPNDLVSRRQMAAFINRLQDHLLGSPYSTTKDYFDDDEGDVGEANLNALASVGIFQGDGQGHVFPGADLTRRQMALILLRDVQVHFAAGHIRSPFDQSQERLTVTPTDVGKLAPVGGIDASTPADDRQYRALGLTTGQAYRITMFASANVEASAGATVFAERAGTGEADPGPLTARLVKVNGSALSAGSIDQSVGGVMPVNGQITFTVDGDRPEHLVPVVHVDEGGASTGLDVDAQGRPTEPFGLGGRLDYLPAEGPAGPATVTVAGVTPERDAFVGTDGRTYTFDANDTYRYQGSVPLTRDQLSSLLSPGDVLAVSYVTDRAGVSSFDVTTDTVEAPAAPSASVTNADSGPTANDVRITYQRPAGGAPGVTYRLQRALASSGPDGFCGTADDVISGAGFVTVPGATDARTGVRRYVFSDDDVPDGCYAYRIRAISPVSSATADSGSSTPGTRVPLATDDTGPTSIFAKMTTVAGSPGLFDAGDVLQIVFDEPLAPLAADATVQLNDGSAGGLTAATIESGVSGTFAVNTVPVLVDQVERPAGTVLRIELTSAPAEDPSLVPGLARPATILGSSGIADPAGNAWNTIGSADSVID